MDTGPNILDLSLMALLAFFLIRALVRGFVREIMGLVGVVAAIVISTISFHPLGATIRHLLDSKSPWWDPIAFVAVLAVVFVFFTSLGSALSRYINAGPFSGLDRLAGGAVGLVKGVLVSYLLINLLLLVLAIHPGLHQTMRDSYLAPHVTRAGSYLVDLIPEDLTRSLQEKAGLWRKPGAPGRPKKP
jgi:membrane protein required for colicin V production